MKVKPCSAKAVAKALEALRQCTTVVPAGIKEADFSDSDDDDTTATLPLFVQKLKALVDDPAIDSAVWSTDGESMRIENPARLSDQLCKYFKASKLNSFVRQLHFYGFKKIGGKRNSGWVYSHQYFQADGRMMHKVRRKTCGPDRQIQNLALKVESLQTSLVDTQRKLSGVASALVAVLKDQQQLKQLPPPSQFASICDDQPCWFGGGGADTGGGNSGGGGGGAGEAATTTTTGPSSLSAAASPASMFTMSGGALPSKRSVPTSTTFDFEHCAMPKRARSGWLPLDDVSPFPQFEMLSPGLLSPRHPFTGGVVDLGGNGGGGGGGAADGAVGTTAAGVGTTGAGSAAMVKQEGGDVKQEEVEENILLCPGA